MSKLKQWGNITGIYVATMYDQAPKPWYIRLWSFIKNLFKQKGR